MADEDIMVYGIEGCRDVQADQYGGFLVVNGCVHAIHDV